MLSAQYILVKEIPFCLSVIDWGINRNLVLAEEWWGEVYWDLSMEEENLKETLLITLFLVMSVHDDETATAISSPWKGKPEEKASQWGWRSERMKAAGQLKTLVGDWINLLLRCPTSGFLTLCPFCDSPSPKLWPSFYCCVQFSQYLCPFKIVYFPRHPIHTPKFSTWTNPSPLTLSTAQCKKPELYLLCGGR